MSGTKVDWGLIKQEFISNRKVSLRQLSKKYEISYSRITKISAMEKWSGQKAKFQEKVEGEAIKEVEGSRKDFLVRHIRLAKFAQSKAVKKLVSIIDEDLSEMGAIRLLSEGLKAERELHPKKLELGGNIGVKATGISKALDTAIYETFRKRIGRKRPSIHRKNSPKK